MLESDRNTSDEFDAVFRLGDVGLDPTAARAIQAKAQLGFTERALSDKNNRRGNRLVRLPRRTVALGTGVLLLTGTAVAATTPWALTVGNDRTGRPSLSATGPPLDAVTILGVLRRPQVPADRGAVAQGILRALGASSSGGVRTASVRLLGTTSVGNALAYSAKKVGPDKHALREVVCFVTTTLASANPSVGSTSGTSCGTAKDVKAGRLIGYMPIADGVRVAGLVADGVTRVSIPFENGVVLRAMVSNNYFDVVSDQKDEVDLSSIRLHNAVTER